MLLEQHTYILQVHPELFPILYLANKVFGFSLLALSLPAKQCGTYAPRRPYITVSALDRRAPLALFVPLHINYCNSVSLYRA